MVTIRILFMLAATAGLADSSAVSENNDVSTGDWRVFTTLAHPTVTADAEVWWVSDETPPRLMCDRGGRVEGFGLSLGQIANESIWYLAADTRGRIWVFGNPATPAVAVFDRGAWRTFDSLERAYSAVADEEKGNPGFRIGNPRHRFYPAFAGDGRVAYRAVDRLAYFDGPRWDRQMNQPLPGLPESPPFYADGVLTVRMGGQYWQLREGQWLPSTEPIDDPYGDIPTPRNGRRSRRPMMPSDPQPATPLRDNTGATWTGTVPDLFRAVGDIEVRFPTAGSPLTSEDRISEVFVDASGRTWFVLSGERWLTGTGDYERMAVYAPREKPPELEWERKPPQLVETGSVSASVRVPNASGGLIVQYQCGGDPWSRVSSKGPVCEIPLGYPLDGVYTLRVQAYDGLLRPSRMLTHRFEVKRDYNVEVKTLVELLGSQDLDEREAAARAMVKLGKPIVPVLRESLKKADADRRWWIQAILDEIAQADAGR